MDISVVVGFFAAGILCLFGGFVLGMMTEREINDRCDRKYREMNDK